MVKKLFALLILITCITSAKAQISLTQDDFKIDYSNPKEYEIGGVTITGIKYLNIDVLRTNAGLTVGDKIKIPGDKISRSIENLWKLGLFSEVNIYVSKVKGNLIFLEVALKERPRLSKFSIGGVKKTDATKVREDIKLTKGDVITENLIVRTKSKIVDYYVAKGFINVEVDIIQKDDTAAMNSKILNINIKKNKKVKIGEIKIIGNKSLTAGQIRRAMKETKQKTWYNVFKASKYIKKDYVDDQTKIIEKYNTLGFRDARIIKDSIYRMNDKEMGIALTIEEGHKFYFRKITFVGNTKYTDKDLNTILGIKKGDVYNQTTLDSRLYMSQDSRDIYSLYMDDGYLFFNATPVEANVENDSIDLEIRISEGKQATINKVTISGNVKTRDKVILREIRTKPGQLFSRADIMRSQRELNQLRYFNPEKIKVNPKPNQADGTVDIEYTVEETSSDQVELSGGWGAGRLVGSLGLSFNNFSARNIFNGSAYTPLPAGDGQMLSIRAQSSGWGYSSISTSFTEPWLGGKKPNALSFSLYRTIQIYNKGIENSLEPFLNEQSLYVNGAVVSLAKRLRWPDDYFTLSQEISFQNYDVRNWKYTFKFANGHASNLSYGITLGRNSIDQPTFPRSGSQFSIRLQATPPYSLMNNKDYSTMSDADKYKWVEYYKWKFHSSWFSNLAGNLVLSTRFQMGYLGSYNSKVGDSPFGRFYVGGDGLSGYAMDEREIIALRGYSNLSVTPQVNGSAAGGAVYNRYTMELRYPISLNPMSTIYVLAFAEGGNAWMTMQEANPFQMKRSAGAGVRITLPMFGMLGLDWGYGFDPAAGQNTPSKGQFHFSINQSID